MPLAQAYGRRIGALFARVGEGFTLIRSGESLPRVGLFAPMDGQTTGIYFDANESVGLIKPSLSVWIEGDSDASAGDVFFRDGRLWTVRKTQIFRHGGTALLALALCD